MVLSGYKHPDYARSLSEFGEPIVLPQSGGFLIKRIIPTTVQTYDAMGCYPVFACNDWIKLGEDLKSVENDLVSLALVTDPFGKYDEELLKKIFPGSVTAFKAHFTADLTRQKSEYISGGRRRMALRALRKVDVEIVPEPTRYVEEWTNLYSHLIEHYRIRVFGLSPGAAFLIQLSLPQTYYIRALIHGEPVGAQICFLQDDVVHCHLSAFTQAGYDAGASYAIDWASIEFFTGKAHWYNLGGGAGITADSNDGLSQYKRGWASDTKTAYFCWRIFNQDLYNYLANQKEEKHSSYFPVYRDGEYT